MLDDGFEWQIQQILKAANSPKRQTLMFSATWPKAAQDLAEEILTDPIECRVGGSHDAYSVNPNINQEVRVVETTEEKPQTLLLLLKARQRAKALVFVAMKRVCGELERKSRRSIGGGSDSIHGDRSQADREAALAAFRNGEIRVLFATDVAGRGLDIPGVDLVVNYDPPQSAEDYVHRIGRTGRGGVKGNAVSILTVQDTSAMRYIAEVMQKSGVDIPPVMIPFVQVGARKRGKGVDPRCSWREPWKGVGGTQYEGNDLASAVRDMWGSSCGDPLPRPSRPLS